VSSRIIGSEKILTCKALVDMNAIIAAKDPQEFIRYALRDLYRKVGEALAGRKDLLSSTETKQAFAMEYEFRALVLGEEDYHYIKRLEHEVVELREQVDDLLRQAHRERGVG
jgi:hypothetical protein